MQGKPEIGLITVIAKALAESVDAKWDAKDFNETQSGETPEEQREYFRDLATTAIKTGFPVLSARLASYEAALRAAKLKLYPLRNHTFQGVCYGELIALIDKALEAK